MGVWRPLHRVVVESRRQFLVCLRRFAPVLFRVRAWFDRLDWSPLRSLSLFNSALLFVLSLLVPRFAFAFAAACPFRRRFAFARLRVGFFQFS